MNGDKFVRDFVGAVALGACISLTTVSALAAGPDNEPVIVVVEEESKPGLLTQGMNLLGNMKKNTMANFGCTEPKYQDQKRKIQAMKAEIERLQDELARSQVQADVDLKHVIRKASEVHGYLDTLYSAYSLKQKSDAVFEGGE